MNELEYSKFRKVLSGPNLLFSAALLLEDYDFLTTILEYRVEESGSPIRITMAGVGHDDTREGQYVATIKPASWLSENDFKEIVTMLETWSAYLEKLNLNIKICTQIEHSTHILLRFSTVKDIYSVLGNPRVASKKSTLGDTEKLIPTILKAYFLAYNNGVHLNSPDTSGFDVLANMTYSEIDTKFDSLLDTGRHPAIVGVLSEHIAQSIQDLEVDQDLMDKSLAYGCLLEPSLSEEFTEQSPWYLPPSVDKIIDSYVKYLYVYKDTLVLETDEHITLIASLFADYRTQGPSVIPQGPLRNAVVSVIRQFKLVEDIDMDEMSAITLLLGKELMGISPIGDAPVNTQNMSLATVAVLSEHWKDADLKYFPSEEDADEEVEDDVEDDDTDGVESDADDVEEDDEDWEDDILSDAEMTRLRKKLLETYPIEFIALSSDRHLMNLV